MRIPFIFNLSQEHILYVQAQGLTVLGRILAGPVGAATTSSLWNGLVLYLRWGSGCCRLGGLLALEANSGCGGGGGSEADSAWLDAIAAPLSGCKGS
jgi:hypothetical protein